jgi:thiamine biosynthesis lipoprotein
LRQTDTVEISDDLFEMLKTYLFYAEKLNGYFDITIKLLKDFWDINSKDSLLPDPNDDGILDTLSKILQDVDFTKISVLENSKRAVFENPKTQIDLGAVAKGFAIDKIKDSLQYYGFNNFIVNIGGDVFISGYKNRKKPIIAGILNPQKKDGVLKSFAMDNGALFTSGNYERFRIAKSGVRVHHIFDTKTGFSVSKNVSLSIRGKNPLVADILSTGLFALSADSILLKIKEFDGYEALVADSLGEIFETEFFTEKNKEKRIEK